MNDMNSRTRSEGVTTNEEVATRLMALVANLLCRATEEGRRMNWEVDHRADQDNPGGPQRVILRLEMGARTR